MLYNIRTGWAGITKRPNEEIVILASSLRTLKERNLPFVFTDRHAYLETANFFTDLTNLDHIDWAILQNRDFKRDAEDPEKVERYQAEALVHKHMPCDGLKGIVCYNDSTAATLTEHIQQRGLALRVSVQRTWYFS